MTAIQDEQKKRKERTELTGSFAKKKYYSWDRRKFSVINSLIAYHNLTTI